MNLKHILGISGETGTAELSSKAPFFDPSSWILQYPYVATIQNKCRNIIKPIKR